MYQSFTAIIQQHTICTVQLWKATILYETQRCYLSFSTHTHLSTAMQCNGLASVFDSVWVSDSIETGCSQIAL